MTQAAIKSGPNTGNDDVSCREEKMSKIDTPVLTIPTSPKIKNVERDYIRLVLVDDHQVVRQGVKAMLNSVRILFSSISECQE
jgi:hypothetical protein